MRRHGWGGALPVDDDDARRRIIAAAVVCIDREGTARTSLSQVAAEVDVTRQTVYRYFASTEELFVAVGREAIGTFAREIEAAIDGLTDPVDVVVEALAFTIERVPSARYLTLMVSADEGEGTGSVGRTILTHASVDWPAHGYDDARLDELIDLLERLLRSMLAQPLDPPRAGQDLRDFLRRWLGPMVRSAA